MVDNIDIDGTSSGIDDDDNNNNNNNNSKFFTIFPQVIDGYETRFGVGVHPSELYQPTGMVLPKLPIYHPYHPLNDCSTNAENEDVILQVPLAMTLPSFDDLHSSLVPPRELLDFIAKRNKDVNYTSTPTTYYIIVQTLPYTSQTRIICRYQYALFPQAKAQMKGKESIWTQSIIYNHHRDNNNNNNNNTAERIRYPPTSIKIYESNKDSPNISPTILCGNSMILDTVENLCGNAIWSYVVGCSTDTSTSPPIVDDENGLIVNIDHSYIGLTYFLPNDEYNNFIREIHDKQSPVDIINWITILIETNKNDSSTTTATVTSSSPATNDDELHEKLRNLRV